jgi:DNA-binding CsgD family transcriptional regulator
MNGPPEILDLLASGHPPAFASDSRDRIVFWNRGAAEIFGRRADEVLGRRCYEVVSGCDVFGNCFCYANCPINATLRSGRAPSGFEIVVAASGPDTLLRVEVLRIPSVRADLFTLVHILEPVDRSGRVARALEQLGATVVDGRAACPAVGPFVPALAPPPLTGREQEVLRHMASGLQNKEIAQALALSVATVRNHVHNILEKLQVHSKLEAVSLAFRNRWTEPATREAPSVGPPASATPASPCPASAGPVS